MERRTGPDPGLDAEGTAAWDTLSTVAVSLVLLLFALLLSLQAVRLQRDSLDARSGEAASAPEITGLRRAAGALVLPPLAFFFKVRAGEGGCKGPGGGVSVIVQLRCDLTVRRRFRGGKAAPRLVSRLHRVIGRFFQRKEGHQALFDDIALVMT